MIVAPAMNDAMYEHPATRANLAALRARGYTWSSRSADTLAEGESGVGRLAAEERILEAIDAALARRTSLSGLRVAITAGPTREAFDPVRFVSNASTGAMGIALAREAALRGADVTLLLGPTLLEPPAGVTVVRVTTARELYDAALEHATGADLDRRGRCRLGLAAANAGRNRRRRRRRRISSCAWCAIPTCSPRSAIARAAVFSSDSRPRPRITKRNAREKLERKHLDAIAVNDVRGERGFGTGENALTLLWGTQGRRELDRADKDALAARLLDAIETLRKEAM